MLDFSPSELRETLSHSMAREVPDYRVDQILEWIYRRNTAEFGAMSNLPHTLRQHLNEKYCVYQSELICAQTSSDATQKLLLEWDSGGSSECVLIPEPKRATGCISTQVGCPVECTFCASGIGGLARNLTAGQIVEQALRLSSMCAGQAIRLSNIVFMGLGEPLANYDATRKALQIINAEWGLSIAARKITLSTVGLPGQIKKLADEGLQITLALSLHAPTDELRRQLIPWAQRVSIDQLVQACRYYFEQTGREVTLEYLLLEGVNNLPSHAAQLAEVSKKMRSNVNLIPYNEVASLQFKRPSDDSNADFAAHLRRLGVNVHLRTSRGLDIDAACGQLRRRHLT